jgi:hypothetical protein
VTYAALNDCIHLPVSLRPLILYVTYKTIILGDTELHRKTGNFLVDHISRVHYFYKNVNAKAISG